MSDPVTNVEVEDVLSSIRKLVSEDTRRDEPDSTIADAPPDRLILQPSQRVDHVAEEAPKAAEPVLLSEAFRADRDPDLSNIPGDARLAEFGEVEGDAPEDDAAEDDTAVEEGQAQDHSEDHSDDPDDDSREELSRLIEEEVSAALSGPLFDDDGDDAEEDAWDEDSLSDPIAEAEDAPFWEAPEEDDDDADVLAFLGSAPVEDDDAPDVTAQSEDDGQYGAEAVGEAELEVPDAPQTLEEKISALERLVSTNAPPQADDQLEDDEVIAASEPMEWPAQPGDEAEEGAMPPLASNVLHSRAWPEAQPHPATDVQQVAQQSTAPATTALDEEQLRALIADTIREELQGTLGERITRNVRKLVRREIHRMLISQDLE